MDEYPDEVRFPPVPVVGFIGAAPFLHLMDKHFTTKKIDGRETPRIKILVKNFEDDLPKRTKERRTSFEGFIPDGILRANWMWRHYNEIPSSIAIFFDWSEDDPEWRQKEGDLCIKLENVRQQAKTRNLKYVVVLVKKEPSPENTYDERFNSFRKRADLDARNIIFFVQSEAKNSTRRLENIMYKLSVDHHKEEGRFYKRLRERMNRVTQQKLLLRVHFKVAYHAEFRQDTKTALKYYHAAFNFVRDMNKVKNEFEEIKVIADFINFKICKLYLERGAVNDAVSQFHRHIKYFKLLVGDTNYEFQHWAWVSRQHKVFAELLSSFPQYNIPKVRGWRSCAFHYNAAANYEILRKKKCNEICEPFRNNDFVKSLMNNNLLTPYRPTRIDIKNQRYVGRGTLRSVLISLGKYDEKSDFKQFEQSEFMCAVAQELIVDHSLNITNLFQKTYEYLKIEATGDRTIATLASQLGKYLYQRGDYEKAKSYFDFAIPFYRLEQWWDLLSEVLQYSLDCCYHLHLLSCAVEYSLELLAPHIPIPSQQKQDIQNRLINTLKLPNGLKSPVIVALDPHSPLLNVRVWFEQEKVYAHTEVEMKLLLVTHFPSPLTFHVLRILFNDSSYNLELKLESADQSQCTNNGNELTLLPENSQKILSFKIPVKNESIIECNLVELELGPPPNNLKFHWSTQNAHIEANPIHDPYAFRERTTVVVLPNPPKLELQIQHSPPALQNEYYPLSVKLINNHDEEIDEVSLSFETNPNLGEAVFFLKEEEKLPGNQLLVKELLPPHSNRTCSLFFYHTKSEQIEIKVKARYHCKSGFSSSVETKVSLQCIFPFATTWELFTPQFSSIKSEELRQNDIVLLCLDLGLNCQTTLELVDVDLVLNVTKDFQPVAINVGSSATTNATPMEILRYGHKYNYWFAIKPQVVGTYALGFASLKWRRSMSQEVDISHVKQEFTTIITHIPLPKVTVQQKFFTVSVDVPTVGVLGELLPHTITIWNHTNSLQEFALVVGNCSDFLISGDKQIRFKIHPQSTFQIQHHFIPITLGHISLPHFEIVPMKSPTLANVSQDFLIFKQQRLIFVKPATKLPMPTL